MVTRDEEEHALAASSDPVSRSALRASFHLRRYMPLYVFGTIWALMLMAFPTVLHHDDNGGSGAALTADTTAAGDGGTTGDTALSTDGGPAAAAADATATPGASASGTAARRTATGGGTGTITPAQVGSGVTRRGVKCDKGVPQIPFSLYSPPCAAKFDGDNGGATVRGVSKDKISIAIRRPSDASGPNQQAIDQAQEQAGQATATQQYTYASKLLPFFNKNYELYGRQVELKVVDGQGNSTDEAQSKGGETACADANKLANSDKVFGVVRWGFNYESQPFAECAKQYGLYVPLGAAYFPEQWYKRWDPYVWATTMDCERIASDVAEYIGKRLVGNSGSPYKARWAGDAAYQAQARKFATYVPNNDGYQLCVDLTEKKLRDEYGTKPTSRYDYALDVSQFPSEAARGVVQFKAANASTLIMACDPISVIFLTQAAANQNYRPEWMLIGVALTDTEGYARLWDQSEIDGHLFGLSQLGRDDRLQDQKGEAATAWKEATGDATMPSGAANIYYRMTQMFDQLQAAGPNLTPVNLARGTHALPEMGGATAPFGRWNFQADHTGIDDSREIYYKASKFFESYNGRRFAGGEWPAEEPPIYK